MNWTTWVLFVGLVWISAGQKPCSSRKDGILGKLKRCLTNEKTNFVVPDDFDGVINALNHRSLNKTGCIVFLQKYVNGQQKWQKMWPQMETRDGAYLLHISKKHIRFVTLHLYVLQGKQCSAAVSNLTDPDSVPVSDTVMGPCRFTYLRKEDLQACRHSPYDENFCNNMDQQVKTKYIINITSTNKNCINCYNPVKTTEKELDQNDISYLNISIEEGEEVRPSKAADVMNKMSQLAASINVSSATVTVGEGVTGVLLKVTEPEDTDEVSFAYASTNDSINIIESRDRLASFSRSVTVSKEAFEKSANSNNSVPFAAVFRFTNMATDEMKRKILHNEVLAIEMGTMINNLTDKISINFRNMTYEGIPSCQSWNGEGSQPNWTSDGCLTIANGENITCQCSHLTFFAILLTPLNETTSSSDLNALTIITQVGCGLSMFFLSIILFMHFLLRKTKASKATRILIHLVSAMFLLNFTFLINEFVAKLKSSVGCKIMAALMHYFMLATFTWFAAQAFHLCLQLYTGGKIVIRYYILKVSIAGWVLPSVVGIVLLVIGKYGERVVHTNDNEETVTMCWITDNNIHYNVNIGYYVLVFLFTFTSFIIIVSWLFCLKRNNARNAQSSRGGKSIITILGLCCMLGITWGFAFYAYGVLRIPACYIFTVLNSFQGFFLFIYYYNTGHSGEINGGESGLRNVNISSNNTLTTNPDSFENPYTNTPGEK